MEKYEDIQDSFEEETTNLAKTTQERLAGMRKKADLSDIILEKEHSSHDKKKKILLGAASLVLIFLIVLIISKMINDSSSSDNKENLETNSTLNAEIQKVAEITPADNLSKTTTSNQTSTPQISATKKVDVSNDTDLKFEEMVRKLKEQDAKENGSETPATNVVTSKKITPVAEKIKSKIVIKNVTPKKETPIKITSTHVKKPKTVNIEIPSFKEFSSGKSGYYIQVGATTKPRPSSALVNKIKSNGFSYTTHSIRVKGRNFNKILVGPFSSKTAAHAKIGMVKATINPQAFLYHLR